MKTFKGYLQEQWGEVNGSIFTFVNDCICDIRFVYGKVNDKLQFIIGKKLQ